MQEREIVSPIKESKFDLLPPIEKERREKLARLIQELAGKLVKEGGLPLTNECRLDEKEFHEVYSLQELERDQQGITKKGEEKGFLGITSRGEKLEELKTVALYQFLKGRLIAVRTSRYDDLFNGMDNLLIDKVTGEILCVFDEVGKASGDAYEKKVERARDKNESGGGQLKYGITKEKEGWKKQYIQRLPVLYFCLEEKYINKAIDSLSSLDEKSEYVKKVVQAFIAIMEGQIAHLRLSLRDPVMRNRVERIFSLSSQLEGFL